MIQVSVSSEISSVCPNFVGACVEAQVVNTPYSDRLWHAIHEVEARLRQELTTESVKSLPSIAATRAVYKLCGKDPSRYRPASEQLIRRMLQGKELYQIDTLVDLVNLASIAYGYSIGGFDADKFVGPELVLGVGKEGEPYEGIPTSDHERTKMTLGTTHLVVLINGYDGNEERVRANAEYIQKLLIDYAQSDGGTITLYR